MSRIQNQKGGFSWFLVLAKRGQERMAKENLERQGFEVYCPMYAPTPLRPVAGKAATTTPRPFLPGYLFVAFDPADPKWGKIFSTYGVRSMYCTGAGGEMRPRALPNAWIEQLQVREVNGLIVRPHQDQIKSRFEQGAPVRYRMATADLDAVFIEAIDAKRVAILVSLLGTDSRQVVDAKTVDDRPS
jgi:transcriptional antiterminator RfaH